MKKFGLYLFLFGVGSFVLNLMGLEFRLLAWVDMWGATAGNVIRGVMAAAGLVMLLAGKSEEPAQESA